MENWKSIPGYEGIYEASDLGRIRSLDRVNSGRKSQGVILQGSKKKYSEVALKRGIEKVRYVLIHKMVLETFIGQRPIGMVACHNNGNSKDNRLSNLRWDTRKSNEADKIIHGTRYKAYGDKCGMAKLRPIDIERIADMRMSGALLKDIGAWIGVSGVHVGRILRHTRWPHMGNMHG